MVTKHRVEVEEFEIDIIPLGEPVKVRSVHDRLDWSEPYSEPDPYNPERRV